jgi:hypothetical protein
MSFSIYCGHIFETGIYSKILYYFIYPAYLGFWYYPKGFLLWPLVGTEKIGMRSSDPSGYSVGSHLYILCFVIYGMRYSDPWLVKCRLPFISDLSNSRVVISFGDMATENIILNPLSSYYYYYYYYSVRWIIRFIIPSTCF